MEEITIAADPLTATMNTLTKALEFGMLVYQDTPKEIRIQGAADWGNFVHGLAKQILKLQALLTPKLAD